MVDAASEASGGRILYDEQIANQRLSIRAPDELPTGSLLDLLRSALRMKGFVLADANAEGWLRIEKADQLTQLSRPKADASMWDPITHGFRVEHTKPADVD